MHEPIQHVRRVLA